MDEQQLLEGAKAVLEANDHGNFTVPASGIYPHQWLWDSCFIAIGLRHTDIDRAQKEILSLLRGQWANGMLPNMILGTGRQGRWPNIWRSWINPNSPDGVNTSGITQPPMLAEAIVQIGGKLSKAERHSWYKKTFPALLKYHEWLFNERDPHGEGLVLQIHPWEVGMDNTPTWMAEIKEHSQPLWITAIDKLHLGPLLNIFRRDTHHIPAGQRLDIIDALVLYSTLRRLRRKRYDFDKIIDHSMFAIEDLAFNCIFIRANQHLEDIARFIHKPLADDLKDRIKKSQLALEELWDPMAEQYFSRNFVTHKLINQSTVATLLPLYAGVGHKGRAKALVKLLEDKHLFGPEYPVPSVPLNSAWYKPTGYWQGSTWVNMNWLLIDGLRRSGFADHADVLSESTLEMVAQSGFNEYFDPSTGKPAGAKNFSWTAALIIDMIKAA